MNQKLLEAKDFSVEVLFKKERLRVVKKVDFHVEEGEAVGLVGESGCGKSTLASGLLRLHAEHASTGTVRFKGIDLLQVSPKDMSFIRGKEIGTVLQSSMSALNPLMPIGRQVEEVVKRHGNFSAQERFAYVLELLKAVGLSDPRMRYFQYPHQLSGGIRQRIAIAIAIAVKPALLIADEPTTALDVTIEAQILDLLQEIQKKNGMAIFLITHDLNIVADFCDRIFIMYAGYIVEEAKCSVFFEKPLHPYSKALLEMLPTGSKTELRSLTLFETPQPDLSSAGCPYVDRCAYAMRLCRTHMPPVFETAAGQRAACWLLSEQAVGNKRDRAYV